MRADGEICGAADVTPHRGSARGIPSRLIVALASALLAALIAGALAPSAQALESGISSTPSSTQPYYGCPNGPCDLVIDPLPVKTASGYELPGGPLLEGSGESGGYSPRDIQSAYNIPTKGGAGETVAVIDPWGDPNAGPDLNKYRERYGLGPCTKANGCFRKVNQKGEERNYPPEEEGFEGFIAVFETSLDTQMVAAACPECNILLVEANTEKVTDLSASVNTAVRLGATEVSASFGWGEKNPECGKTGCTQFKSNWQHSGVPIAAASGDKGYRNGKEGVSFPASMPGVIAVGGTNLFRAKNARGWREEVWESSGSGCSEFEPKPPAQTDKGCAKRTTNDVAAVAGCKTPVTIYVTRGGGFVSEGICGTSVATPIIAGLMAHAEPYTRSLGSEAFYRDPEAMFDVTTGSDGTCTTTYLCTARVGYDGPTGLGTPGGVPFVRPP
jgi:subtilase family serine protease